MLSHIVADVETRRYSSFLGIDLPGVSRYCSSDHARKNMPERGCMHDAISPCVRGRTYRPLKQHVFCVIIQICVQATGTYFRYSEYMVRATCYSLHTDYTYCTSQHNLNVSQIRPFKMIYRKRVKFSKILSRWLYSEFDSGYNHRDRFLIF